ncbi:pepsin/retropepsin-like aspartic protease family protein [Metallibacterium sp.]|uniref:pepsin/retropepsin-like aspartic protease family protein n=1 Tax=Metallibacterium sp. TaxID=2940281 RepID=UPI0026158C7C|nr:pepsin/retropepsin-like aspartic protease family protein [Metallibacterium sp.]
MKLSLFLRSVAISVAVLVPQLIECGMARASHSIHITLHPPLVLNTALQSGVLVRIHKRAATEPALELGLAVNDRISGSLSNSSAHATHCMDLSNNNFQQYIGVGIYCEMIRAGNYYIQDRLHKWARVMSDIEKRVEAGFLKQIAESTTIPKHVKESALGEKIKIANVPDLNFAAIESNTAFKTHVFVKNSEIQRIRHLYGVYEFPLPLHLNRSMYIIPGLINRKPLLLIMDTGASKTLINSKVAQRLGVKILIRHYEYATDPLIRKSNKNKTPTSLGVIRDFQLGRSSFHDLYVLVARNVPSVLGLDVLTRIRHLLISRREIKFGEKEQASCKKRLRLVSNWLGSAYYFTLDVNINGKYERAELDTGSSDSLDIYQMRDRLAPATDQHVRRYYTVSGFHSMRMTATHILLNGVRVTGSRISSSVPPQTVLGFGILKHFDIAVDFSSDRACLIKVPHSLRKPTYPATVSVLNPRGRVLHKRDSRVYR